jgi:hypothetical protein
VRNVTTAWWLKIQAGSRRVGVDPGRPARREAHRPFSQRFEPSRPSAVPTCRHPVRFPARVAASGVGPAVAKASIRKEHVMIAATAFAIVGLVVVAFLNRIP